MADLARDVEKQPDAYQQERAERFGYSQRGISDALQRLRISRKLTATRRSVCVALEYPKTEALMPTCFLLGSDTSFSLNYRTNR